MKLHLLTSIIIFCFFSGFAQRNNFWCFGHEAAINFNTVPPTPDSSAVISRGSCASIADSSGQLEFYAYTRAGIAGNTGQVWNNNHQLMQNGDSIVGEGWYNELLIIPFADSDSLFYLFSTGVTGSSQNGIYYSVIDKSLNGGSGEVVQKNIQLQTFQCTDGLTAIKHGNGRDWWIVFKRWDIINNTYYKYLISPTGISNLIIQDIGTSTDNGFARMEFSADGNKMALLTLTGILEIYDFDRCTGLLSNVETIFPEIPGPPYNRNFWDGQFSPSGNLFYTSLIALPGVMDSCYLIQYDLNAANIPLSADTLGRDSLSHNMGQIKLGPDNKIYLSSVYNNMVSISYPYPDTVHSLYNTYLGVINQPDNIGISCDFQPFSFYLGGERTYLGLPNNPDYELGPVVGSPCDTLVSISEYSNNESGEIFVYYASSWQTAYINVQKLKGHNYLLQIIDVSGKVAFRENGTLSSSWFTKNLNCTAFSKGIYIAVFKTEQERLVRKFVIE